MSAPDEGDGTDAGESSDALLDAGYRYALSLVGHEPNAEDLLQDGWLALLQARGPMRRGYLFRCIRSRFIDRHRRVRLVSIEPIPPEEMEAIADDAPTAVVERIDARGERIASALARLRPEEREALFLHAVEGYTAAEVAELTERPRGTVLSLLHRARSKLRADLAATEVRG